ncbi:MAG: LysR family transcriptional regulator [Lachnospiraceae bacterium]|nr:LysR family transcriptional regulator [Lachnospiraceae bacterium]
MELRELEYFLAIVNHGTISEASRFLHITQPALTRSLQHLEEELGSSLIIRGSRRIELTNDGILLRRRAEEILHLAKKTKAEIQTSDEQIEGDIYICSGESKGLHFLTQAMKKLRDTHPNICLHISSGDMEDVQNRLEAGLIDFGLLFPPFDHKKYESIRIPFADTWGLFMRKDAPLARKDFITSGDLINQPLILPRNSYATNQIPSMLNLSEDQIQVSATYSLIFNGALMVTDGLGYLLGLNHILNLSGKTIQCFRPLYPTVTDHMHICWKRYAPMSRQAAALKDILLSQNADQVQFLFN